MSNNDTTSEKAEFQLSSVIQFDEGHYVNCCRGLQSDEWVKIDNHNVTEITLYK